MTTQTSAETNTTPMFQLKGGMYPLSSLQLLGTNLELLATQLDSKIEQAPKFFYQAPIVIDLQKINKTGIEIDFVMLKEILRTRHIIPVGVRGGVSDQQKAASFAGLAILPESQKGSNLTSSMQSLNGSPSSSAFSNGSSNSSSSLSSLSLAELSMVALEHKKALLETTRTLSELEVSTQNLNDPVSTQRSSAPSAATAPLERSEVENTEVELRGTPTKLITEPVRSGQQIYARGGDLIVLAPVSHGAELLADGHIHVYGPLRGRALAGVTGDQSAHIFCHSLEAELVSIAGQYKISEDMEPLAWRLSVDIFLEDGRLHIRAF